MVALANQWTIALLFARLEKLIHAATIAFQKTKNALLTMELHVGLPRRRLICKGYHNQDIVIQILFKIMYLLGTHV